MEAVMSGGDDHLPTGNNIPPKKDIKGKVLTTMKVAGVVEIGHVLLLVALS